MQFIKTHLISLLCGVAGLGFLGAAVWGMMVTSVTEEMKKRVSNASVIRSLQSNPKNEDLINAEKLRGDKFQAEFVATLAVARDINRRQPLIQGVFPKPDKRSTPYEFQDKYKRALRSFSVTLLSDGPPTESDIAEEEENVIDLQAMEAELEAENAPKEEKEKPRRRRPNRGGGRGRNVAPRGGGVSGEGGLVMGEGMMHGGGGLAGPGGAIGEGGGRGRGAFPSANRTRRSIARTGEPKYDPVYRALVAKARSIRCYATPDASFHVSPAAIKESAPTPQEMWEAQVGLWIQQDVVDAIAELNNKAALAVRDGDAFVEQMSVKRIEYLQIHGYKLPNAAGYYQFRSVSAEQRSAADAPPTSFTGREPDDQFDVLHFSLTIFVDQRELLNVIDHISAKNFYKCIGLEYRKLEPEDLTAGYMYGTGPVVRAKIQFEAYMARPVYAPMMPKSVRVILGIEKDNG